MNILFLTMHKFTSIKDRGIYSDLLRQFTNEKHNVFIVSPSERRDNRSIKIIKEDNVVILKVNTLNLQKTSLIEKGIGQLLLEYQFLKAIKLNFSKIQFNLVLYSTPPITFYKVINYIKLRDNAFSYLLLKDIFPQNAVDLKMIKANGILHNFFLKKERKLYQISDKIGCMSPANVRYILDNNSWLDSKKVEVNPNSISPIEIKLTKEQKINIRDKYNLPINKKIFIYGGNLGVPQGVDFLMEIIENCKNNKVYFLIVGAGTQYQKIKDEVNNLSVKNVSLIKSLPKKGYDLLLASCDVGMIFLHKNFTIPNFPSRLLSYLEMKMPVFSATDKSTDIGQIIEVNKCGFGVKTGDLKSALNRIDQICSNKDNFREMMINSGNLLQREYKVQNSYKLIIKAINN